MSTRSIIARAEGDGWVGHYHHFDGYPTGVGKALYDMANSPQFNGDIERMMKVLVEDHPGGWSSICDADWSLEPGFEEYRPLNMSVEEYYSRPRRPKCYCHGDRSEGPYEPRTHEQHAMAYEEYLYVVHVESGVMTIFDTHANYGEWDPILQDYPNATVNLQMIGQVDLLGDEPEWGDFEPVYEEGAA